MLQETQRRLASLKAGRPCAETEPPKQTPTPRDGSKMPPKPAAQLFRPRTGPAAGHER